MELSVLDLFSGIGGFSVGLEATGKFKTIAFCEKDKFCQKVLQKHWQGTKIYEDIRDIDGTKIKADVITGGFPCQPFSTAGKRKGTEDDRYLFPEMLRIIKETQARWVVGENVQGIVNMSEGKVLQGIHNDLETIGYEVQTFIIPASSQGAWHKRNRVWIVAALSNSNINGHSNEQKFKTSNEKKQLGFIGASKNISNSNNIRCKGHSLQSDNLQKGNSATENVNSSFKKQQTWWETQQLICGVPNGISYELDKNRTNRIKSLGNAIVPQIATEIGKAIIKAEEQE